MLTRRNEDAADDGRHCGKSYDLFIAAMRRRECVDVGDVLSVARKGNPHVEAQWARIGFRAGRAAPTLADLPRFPTRMVIKASMRFVNPPAWDGDGALAEFRVGRIPESGGHNVFT